MSNKAKPAIKMSNSQCSSKQSFIAEILTGSDINRDEIIKQAKNKKTKLIDIRNLPARFKKEITRRGLDDKLSRLPKMQWGANERFDQVDAFCQFVDKYGMTNLQIGAKDKVVIKQPFKSNCCDFCHNQIVVKGKTHCEKCAVLRVF